MGAASLGKQGLLQLLRDLGERLEPCSFAEARRRHAVLGVHDYVAANEEHRIPRTGNRGTPFHFGPQAYGRIFHLLRLNKSRASWGSWWRDLRMLNFGCIRKVISHVIKCEL